MDLPGFGTSGLPREPRLSSYADDVLEALDQIGVERFLLVGHSLGGGVATAMAERAPQRVAGLVLIAPVGFGRVPVAQVVALPGVSQAVRLGLPIALANRLPAEAIYRAFVANGEAPDPELVERLRLRASRTRAGAWAANRTIVASAGSRRAFHRRRVDYDGAVDVLWGTRDRLVPPAHRNGVLRAFPQADVSLWSGMGHHPQRERPDELAAFLERTWRRTAPGAGRRAA